MTLEEKYKLLLEAPHRKATQAKVAEKADIDVARQVILAIDDHGLDEETFIAYLAVIVHDIRAGERMRVLQDRDHRKDG